MTAAITGLKISHPLSNELIVGFSQNVPPNSPAEPAPSRMSAPAQNALPAPVTIATHASSSVAEAIERGVEPAAHVAVDRVQRVGPVVGDRRDVPVELVEDDIVGHRASFAGRAPRRFRREATPPVGGAARLLTRCP